METWLIVFLSSVLILLSLNLLFTLFSSLYRKQNGKHLPPGPTPLPLIGNILLLNKPPTELYTLLKKLHSKYGPVITLYVGRSPMIFVATRAAAHEAFIVKGAIFSGHSPSLPLSIVNHEKDVVSSASYGESWRILRGNLVGFFNSNVRVFSENRKWALEILIKGLQSESKFGSNPVQVMDHFEFSMYSMQTLMVFGAKIEDVEHVKRLKRIHDKIVELLYSNELNLNPKLGKILFWKQWKEFRSACEARDEALTPLVRERKKYIQEYGSSSFSSYLDTLFELEIPDENGKPTKLGEDHIVSLCTEALNGGSHTTATLFHWIMAEIVNSRRIQDKLFAEIARVVCAREENVKDEDLPKIPYLKAVVLEGLRCHHLADFTFPRTAISDTEIHGYRVPKGCDVVYTVGEVVTDPEVWDSPLEFRPERFLTGGEDPSGVSFDVTGSKEISMLPFGIGRRICPGNDLGMHHLEYFVANLIWKFNWTPVEGDSVDMSVKYFAGVKQNKHPLRANISPRSHNSANI